MAQTANSGERATFVIAALLVVAVVVGLVFGGVGGLTMVMVALTPVILAFAVLASAGN